MPFSAPEAIARAPASGGVEALAPLPDRRILMLAQGLKREGGTRTSWLVGDGAVETLGYLTAPNFLPTDGATLLFILSNDNFTFFQRTLLLLFRLQSAGRPRAAPNLRPVDLAMFTETGITRPMRNVEAELTPVFQQRQRFLL